MTSSINKTLLFHWELKAFRTQWHNNADKDIISPSFNVGPFCFVLFYNTTYTGYWKYNSYGVILKDLAGKESVEASLKLWLENEEGQMFQENSIKKHVFSKVGDRRQFSLKTIGDAFNSFMDTYNTNRTLHVCCKIFNLNCQVIVPKADYTQFHQDMWSMYEQGIHDAIIKIGETEFKISKFPFMSHSEVFKNMFNLDFKERETSIVEVKDISEQAMKQLVKWIYTCQIEDKSTIEDLYKVADKYQVHLLKTRCSELMISSLDNANVFRRFVLAMSCNDQQLKDFALSYIDRMSGMEVTAYVTSPAWFELAQNNSAFVTEINKLANDKLKK